MKGVSEEAREILAAWHAARPTLALFGEFSAGKSTLLNVLLGRDILPTRATATAMPAVWATHGATRRAFGLTRSGSQIELDPDALDHGSFEDLLAIRLEDPAEILESLDILDTPGISDARLKADLIPFLAAHVDFAIWCSPVTQLWRQSERAMWRSLPATLRARSILLVTGADRVSPDDLARAMSRAVKETTRLFGRHLAISSPSAIAAREARSEEDWLQSGAAEVISAILDTAETVERDFTPLVVSKPTGKVIFEAPAPQDRVVDALREREGAFSNVLLDISHHLEKTYETTPDVQLSATVEHIRDMVNGHKDLDDDERGLVERILWTGGGGRPDLVRVIRQMIGECTDFADGPWRRLG